MKNIDLECFPTAAPLLGIGRHAMLGLVGLVASLAVAPAALAEEESPTAAEGTNDASPAVEAKPTGFWERDTLTGDWGGARTKLVDGGITLGLRYTGEVFGTVAGGVHRGEATDHQFLATGDIDFEKAAGLEGLTGHVSGFSVLGHGPSWNQVKNALDVSNTEIYGEGEVKTRLWTLWLQQTALEGQISVRAGQISTDDEFYVSTTAANLLNSTFANFALNFANLPAGKPVNPFFTGNGPAYPLGAPGVRVTYAPNDNIAWLTAVTTHQPESIDRGGAQFKFDGDAYIISELQYLVNQAKDATGLPAMYKLGGWYDTAKFANLGKPGTTTGQGAIYGVIDQTVVKTEKQAYSLFLRAGVAPDDDISTVTWYVDGGVGAKGLIPSRGDDVFTVAFTYAGVGDGFTKAVGGGDYESVIEVNYLASLAPWWTVQPDFQYVIHPSYGVPGSLNVWVPTAAPNSRIPDATVFGVRTTVTF